MIEGMHFGLKAACKSRAVLLPFLDSDSHVSHSYIKTLFKFAFF